MSTQTNREFTARRAATNPKPLNHGDTEDTEKGGLFKTYSLRDLGVSVVKHRPGLRAHSRAPLRTILMH